MDLSLALLLKLLTASQLLLPKQVKQTRQEFNGIVNHNKPKGVLIKLVNLLFPSKKF
jgi:hypothetical protein